MSNEWSDHRRVVSICNTLHATVTFFISPEWKAAKRNLALGKVVTRGSGNDAARVTGEER